MVHTHNGPSLAISKSDRMPSAATRADPETVALSEVRQAGRDGPHIYCLCVDLNKNGTNKLIHRTEMEPQM